MGSRLLFLGLFILPLLLNKSSCFILFFHYLLFLFVNLFSSLISFPFSLYHSGSLIFFFSLSIFSSLLFSFPFSLYLSSSFFFFFSFFLLLFKLLSGFIALITSLNIRSGIILLFQSPFIQIFIILIQFLFLGLLFFPSLLDR